jgi:FKBP-type peptidyl-prolyl cis-trans isomerase
MQKTALFVILSAISLPVLSQVKPKAPAKPKPVVAKQPAMKTLNDSASYAIGVSVGSFYKQQGISNLNTALVAKAIADVFNGRPTLLDEDATNAAVTKLINKVQESKSRSTIEAGEAFLAKNKTRPGVKTTASGLQYEVLTEGTGAKPTSADSVTVNYAGTLIDGFEFDNSYKRGAPVTFQLNRVIPGWTEGVQLMSVGSKYKFYIPYTLGYGIHGAGAAIPGGAVLIFEVELLDVKKGY